MKVIFQQDVRGQGKKGEMKEVSEGYGRNYLLPRGLAVEANKDNLNTLALKEKARKAQEARERAEAEEAAAKLKDVIVTVRAKAGANGRLFRQRHVAGDRGRAARAARRLHREEPHRAGRADQELRQL